MINFIPLEAYAQTILFVLLVFICVAIVLFLGDKTAVLYSPGQNNEAVQMLGWLCLAVLTILLGLRPISYAFGDMGNYNKRFIIYQLGAHPEQGDLLFEWTVWFFANFLTASTFFFFCIVVYLWPIAIAGRRLLAQYWPIAFLFSAAQIDFYGYGVNGIRQGMAASVFLLALVANRKWQALLAVLVAIGLHKSFVVPAALLFLVLFQWNPRYYLSAWAVCLGIATLLPSLGNSLADSLILTGGFEQYLDPDSTFVEQFSAVGFRPDFLLYSILPMCVGGYFIFLRNVQDIGYFRIYCLYVGCNAFWLVMMHTVLSNRIAYLSWFMMGFVIAYPLVLFRGMPAQHHITTLLLAGFYLFTFVSRA